MATSSPLEKDRLENFRRQNYSSNWIIYLQLGPKHGIKGSEETCYRKGPPRQTKVSNYEFTSKLKEVSEVDVSQGEQEEPKCWSFLKNIATKIRLTTSYPFGGMKACSQAQLSKCPLSSLCIFQGTRYLAVMEGERDAKWAPGRGALLCKTKSCYSLVLSGALEREEKASLSLDSFQSARRDYRGRSVHLPSPIVSPHSQIWDFLSIHPVEGDARSPSCLPRAESKHQTGWDAEAICPWRASSLAESKPREPTTCPAALEATAQGSPLAETIKVNKNWKVIAYLLFPQLDTFPPQEQGIWRFFCLATKKASTSSTACTQTGKQTTTELQVQTPDVTDY